MSVSVIIAVGVAVTMPATHFVRNDMQEYIAQQATHGKSHAHL